MIKQLGVCLVLTLNFSFNWALNKNKIYNNNYGPSGIPTFAKISDFDQVIKEWKVKQKKSVNPSGYYNSGRSWYHDSSQGRYLYVQDKNKNTARLQEKTTTTKNINTKLVQKLLTSKIATKKLDAVNVKKAPMQITITEEPVTDIPSLLYWLEKAVLKIFADQLPNNPAVTKTETENLAKLAIQKSKMERLAAKQKTTKKRPTTTKSTKSKTKTTIKKAALSCWIKKEGSAHKATVDKMSTKRTTEILQYRQKTGSRVTILTKKLSAAKSTTKRVSLGKKSVEKSGNRNNLNKVSEYRQNIENKKRTTAKFDKKVSTKVKGAASKKTSTTKTFKNEPAIECLLQKSGQHRGYYDCINVK